MTPLAERGTHYVVCGSEDARTADWGLGWYFGPEASKAAMMNKEAERRAIAWIQEKLDGVSDLPPNVIRAIWVTVYRGMELGLIAEGKMPYPTEQPNPLLANTERLGKTEKALLAFEFIITMIPEIRSSRGTRDFEGNCGLLEYMLKWGHVEVKYSSHVRKWLARLTTNPDPLFGAPVPTVLFEARL